MTRSNGFRMRSWFAPAVLIAVSAGARFAFGAEDEAAARALFNEARRLAAAGDYTQACPKFEDSYQLDPGIGTSFNWADCLEHLGRTASAWARFLDVAAATHVAGQPERERLRASAAALEPERARLSIVVGHPIGGLVIKLDATVIGQPAWGVAVPVDPGTHTIEAAAPQKRSWSTTVDVPANPHVVAVEIPRLLDLPKPAPAGVASGETSPLRAGRAERPTEQPGRRTLSPLLVATGLLAIGGLTVGTVFEVELQSRNGELKEICVSNPNTCPAPDVARYNALHRDAINDLTYTSIGFGVAGGAALVAAYLWWRSSPLALRSTDTDARFVAAPWIGSGAWGLSAAIR